MNWQEALVYCAENPNAEVVSRRGFKRRITEKGQAQRFANGEWQHSAINPLGQPYEKVAPGSREAAPCHRRGQ